MVNEEPGKNGEAKHPFDLEERTAKFGEAIVRFSKKIPRNPTNNRLIDQLVGCGTSVSEKTQCEADERELKKISANSQSTKVSCVQEQTKPFYFSH